MAFLKVTKHYTGHFPLDGGGAMFGGYGHKEVTPDSVADFIAANNYPFIVKCDKNGVPLVDVPPLPGTVVAQVTAPPVEAPAPKSEAPVEAGSLDQTADEVQPTIEVVETKKASKKGK